MRPPHIQVIDPAVHTAELDCFNRMAVASPVPLTYHLPALHGMASVERDDTGVLGVVVLGSQSSVHDRLPWQAPLADWLRATIGRGTPVLGICFGHQLVGHLFGARVEYLHADRTKLVGFQAIRLDANPLWGDACTGALYVSHREVVTTCPDDLVVTASRPDVPIDGFAHRTLPVWTLQAHPEATPGFRPDMDAEPSRYEFGHGLVQRFLAFAAARRDRIR